MLAARTVSSEGESTPSDVITSRGDVSAEELPPLNEDEK